MTEHLTGFHGTDSDCVKSIRNNNFYPSEKADDWLGWGVYFFVDGVSCPFINAKEWAKNQAYSCGSYKYTHFSVVKAFVYPSSDQKVLDLTSSEGLKAFNVLRDKVLQKSDLHFDKNRNIREDDRIVWNIISDAMDLEVVIHNLYIKNKKQRIKRIASNVPNTTVMCIKKCDVIDIDSIDVVFSGSVKS